MSSESNPFAPPATADLDAGSGGAAAAGAVVSEGALRELVAGGAWARWLARMMVVSIVTGFASAVSMFVRPQARSQTTTALVSAVFGTIVYALFLTVLRRYAAAAERLGRGERAAAARAIDAQGAYFKMAGVMVLLTIGAGVIAFIVVIVVTVGKQQAGVP